jgi:hypothetical protein
VLTESQVDVHVSSFRALEAPPCSYLNREGIPTETEVEDSVRGADDGVSNTAAVVIRMGSEDDDGLGEDLTMTREEVQETLRRCGPELKSGLGIAALAVFGSVARGQAAPGSDVDILVDFDGPADFDRFMELKEWLEAALGIRVDLVTRKALRPALRDAIEREAVRVA